MESHPKHDSENKNPWQVFARLSTFGVWQYQLTRTTFGMKMYDFPYDFLLTCLGPVTSWLVGNKIVNLHSLVDMMIKNGVMESLIQCKLLN